MSADQKAAWCAALKGYADEQLRKQWDRVRSDQAEWAPSLRVIFKREFVRRKLPLPCSIDDLFEEVCHELPKPWPQGALGALSAPGWRIRKKKFERFLKEYKIFVDSDAAWVAAALEHDESKRLRLLKKIEPIRRRFGAVYGQVLSQLVHVPMDSPGKAVPFFNLGYFGLSSSDLEFTRQFRHLTLASYLTTPGSARGAPRGTRSLSHDEQKLAEKMRRRGKGTEKGSLRFIEGEFRERNLPSAKKKTAATIQNLKRFFRRKKA